MVSLRDVVTQEASTDVPASRFAALLWRRINANAGCLDKALAKYGIADVQAAA
jgi:hypothetical protein